MTKFGEVHKLVLAGEAHEALTGKRFVKRASVQGTYDMADTKGEDVDGVVLFDTAIGYTASVVVDGVVEVESGAAFNLHAEITTDANGKAIATDGASQHLVGKALQAATDAGQFISIELYRGRMQSA